MKVISSVESYHSILILFRESNNVTLQSEPLDSDIISTSDSKEADERETASTYATDNKSHPMSISESPEVPYLKHVNTNDKLDRQYIASGAWASI